MRMSDLAFFKFHNLKYLLLLYTYLTFPMNSFSQCRIELNGFNQEGDVAYLGVHNNVECSILNVHLETDNGAFFRGRELKYIPSHLGPVKIMIYYSDGDHHAFDSCSIRVEYLPFKLLLGKYVISKGRAPKIEKAEFLTRPFIMNALNTNLNANASILSFSIKVQREARTIFETHFDKYSREDFEKMNDEFDFIESKDRVLICNMRYQYVEEHIIQYPDVWFSIK